MNLSKLGDDQLDSEFASFVRQEREILTTILHHLKEVDRRRLYSKYGYSSLYDYAMKHHGYSGDQAYRRISAMKLLTEIPEIEEKITSGALTLTNLSNTKTLFQKEKKMAFTRTKEEKLQLLKKLENRTTREADKILQAESLFQHAVIEGADFEFRASPELEMKIQRLLSVTSHTNPNRDLTKLIDAMADLCLEKWDPVKKAERAKLYAEKKTQQAGLLAGKTAQRAELLAGKKTQQAELHAEKQAERAKPSSKENEELAEKRQAKITKDKVSTEHVSCDQDAVGPAAPNVVLHHESFADQDNDHLKANHAVSRRYIPADVKYAVYQRDQGLCQNCGSDHFIEIDHIVPIAQSGTNELKNLRLLCRACNQRHAIVKFGQNKMDSYLKAPTREYRAS